MARRQGIFWILTLPGTWSPPDTLPDRLQWIRGQQELAVGGLLHWQVFVAFKSKTSLAGVKTIFPPETHAELSRSEAAIDYCWKEETSVAGTRFELGARPFRRASATDWESVWTNAKLGDLSAIPASVRVQSYRTLRAIQADYSEPVEMDRQCWVFWGATGTGKSRRAWEEAGVGAYPKDPRSKFWCGYRGHENVVIDEFRGGIDVSHMLRWLDRYPVLVEVKGGSCVYTAKRLWITSNLHPREWYPELDESTKSALLRRLIVTEYINPFP